MKLPKPVKRGDTYRIQLMIDGEKLSCTRDTIRECEKWAAEKILESKIKKNNIEQGIKPKITFKEVFDQYWNDIGQYKKSKASRDWIQGQLKIFDVKFGFLSATIIYDITPQQLTNWRNKRLKEVGANTVLKEISFYSALFTYAEKELFLINENPWMGISKPPKPKPRMRRIHASEIELMLKALNYERGQIPVLSEHYVAWGFLFAIETAIRRGELLALMKKNIHDDYIHIAQSKNGEARNVPLSEEAVELLKLIQHDSRKIIPQSENAFRLMWEKRKAATGLHGLHFHDTRHEAISRMVRVRKLQVETLAKITGHKKIEVLVNTYYNPDASDLVEAFNRQN